MTIKNIIDREVWVMNMYDDSNCKLSLFDIFDNDEKYANVYYLRSGRKVGFFYKDKNQKRANRIYFHAYYQKDTKLRYNEMIYCLINFCRRKVKIEGDFSYYFNPLFKAAVNELSDTIEAIYKAGEVTEDIINAQLNKKIDREYSRFLDDEWQKVGKIVKNDFGYTV